MSFSKDNSALRSLARLRPSSPKTSDYKHHRMKRKRRLYVLEGDLFPLGQRRSGRYVRKLMDAPQVLSVGDLHLENFGTWRDGERPFWSGASTISTEAAVHAVPARSSPFLAASISPCPRRFRSGNQATASGGGQAGLRGSGGN